VGRGCGEADRQFQEEAYYRAGTGKDVKCMKKSISIAISMRR
jgi:hypothetical protein